jgi:putative transposase
MALKDALSKTGEPVAKRQVAAHLIKSFNLSQRRACELVNLQRCIYRYRSRRAEEAPLRERLKQLALEHPRWGYRFLCTLLRREGHRVNHKRVFRLYRIEGLKLRSKRRKKVFSVQRVKPPETTGINQNGAWIL